jgi:BCD family chlorophyll transporter-like MFS transporter
VPFYVFGMMAAAFGVARAPRPGDAMISTTALRAGASPAAFPEAAGDHVRWRDVFRLGLAQIAIGMVAALMMSTLNRVMVVELDLPASVPSGLVAVHFAVQLARARLGFASDRTGRRAPWVIGGAAMLAVGATLAAVATALMATRRGAGLALAVVAYALIGLGLSASGTALLAVAASTCRRVGSARWPRRCGS